MEVKRVFHHDTPMPFGKHEGVPVSDVPPDYLLWLRENIKPGNNAMKIALFDYIDQNLEDLEFDSRGEFADQEWGFWKDD